MQDFVRRGQIFSERLGFWRIFLGQNLSDETRLEGIRGKDNFEEFLTQRRLPFFFLFISLGCWKGNPHFFTKYAEGCVWCPSSPDSFSNTLHMIRVVEADRLELFGNCPFDFLLHD